MLLILCATGQVLGAMLVISDELRVLVLSFSSLVYCFMAFQSSAWNGDIHHGNPEVLGSFKIQILRSHSTPITSQSVGINPSMVFCKAPQTILTYSQISGPVVETTASQPLLCIRMIQGSYFYIDSYTVHGSCTSSKLPMMLLLPL